MGLEVSLLIIEVCTSNTTRYPPLLNRASPQPGPLPGSVLNLILGCTNSPSVFVGRWGCFETHPDGIPVSELLCSASGPRAGFPGKHFPEASQGHP